MKGARGHRPCRGWRSSPGRRVVICRAVKSQLRDGRVEAEPASTHDDQSWRGVGMNVPLQHIPHGGSPPEDHHTHPLEPAIQNVAAVNTAVPALLQHHDRSAASPASDGLPTSRGCDCAPSTSQRDPLGNGFWGDGRPGLRAKSDRVAASLTRRITCSRSVAELQDVVRRHRQQFNAIHVAAAIVQLAKLTRKKAHNEQQPHHKQQHRNEQQQQQVGKDGQEQARSSRPLAQPAMASYSDLELQQVDRTAQPAPDSKPSASAGDTAASSAPGPPADSSFPWQGSGNGSTAGADRGSAGAPASPSLEAPGRGGRGSGVWGGGAQERGESGRGAPGRGGHLEQPLPPPHSPLAEPPELSAARTASSAPSSSFSAASSPPSSSSSPSSSLDPCQLPLLRDLVADFTAQLAHCSTARQVANVVWALGSMRCRAEPAEQQQLLAAAAVVLLEQGGARLAAAQPQELANLALGLAHLGYRQVPLWAAIISASKDRLPDFKPQELHNLAWAVAAASQDRSMISAAVQAALPRLRSGFNPSGLANLLWACATAQCPCEELFDGAAEALLAAPGSELCNQDVANAAWAFAKLQHPHPRLMAHLGRWVLAVGQEGVANAQTQELVNMLWAFGSQPPAPWEPWGPEVRERRGGEQQQREQELGRRWEGDGSLRGPRMQQQQQQQQQRDWRGERLSQNGGGSSVGGGGPGGSGAAVQAAAGEAGLQSHRYSQQPLIGVSESRSSRVDSSLVHPSSDDHRSHGTAGGTADAARRPAAPAPSAGRPPARTSLLAALLQLLVPAVATRPDLTPQGASNALWACARAQPCPLRPPDLAALLAAANARAAAMSDQELCNALWAAGQLRQVGHEVPAAAVAALVAAAYTPGRLEGVVPVGLAQLVDAAVHLGLVGGSGRMDGLAARVLRCLPAARPQELCVVAQAVAEAVRVCKYCNPMLLNALGNAAVDIIDQLDPQGLTNILWAFARAKHYHGQLTTAVCRAAQPRLEDFSDMELANLVWALAVLKSQERQLLVRVARLVVSRVRLRRQRRIAAAAAAAAEVTQPAAVAVALRRGSEQAGEAGRRWEETAGLGRLRRPGEALGGVGSEGRQVARRQGLLEASPEGNQEEHQQGLSGEREEETGRGRGGDETAAAVAATSATGGVLVDNGKLGNDSLDNAALGERDSEAVAVSNSTSSSSSSSSAGRSDQGEGVATGESRARGSFVAAAASVASTSGTGAAASVAAAPVASGAAAEGGGGSGPVSPGAGLPRAPSLAESRTLLRRLPTLDHLHQSDSDNDGGIVRLQPHRPPPRELSSAGDGIAAGSTGAGGRSAGSNSAGAPRRGREAAAGPSGAASPTASGSWDGGDVGDDASGGGGAAAAAASGGAPTAKGHAKSMAKLLWSYAKSDLYNAPLFRLLGHELTPLLHLLTPHEMAQVLWAMAYHQHSCPDLLDAAAHVALVRLRRMCAWDASVVAWAFGKLRHPNRQLLEALQRHALMCEERYRDPCLCRLAWACAQLDVPLDERLQWQLHAARQAAAQRLREQGGARYEGSDAAGPAAAALGDPGRAEPVQEP